MELKTTETATNSSSKLSFVKALLVAAIFLVVELIVASFHEMWGDEVHSWALVNSSHSVGELIANTCYEGHPLLWYALLYILQLFTHQIFAMQVLHVSIAACTVFTICYFSPFKQFQTILTCFGHFFAYEYCIVSRNYAIEVLLLFLCAGLYTRHGSKYLLLIALLFFLMLQANVYALIIGIPFYGYMSWEIYKSGLSNTRSLIVSTIIVLTGIVLAILTIKPPVDSGFLTWITTPTFFDFAHVLSIIYTSYLPIPGLTVQFWCTNILHILTGHVYIEAVLAIIIFVLTILLFKNNKSILLLYITGTAGVLLFTYTKNYGWLRHHGHIYILFILCYWLYKSNQPTDTISKWNTWLQRYFVTFVLIAQVAASMFCNIGDVMFPFSNNRLVADYIRENTLNKHPLLGDGDYAVSGIAGYLNEDIYFMRPKRWGTWIKMDTNWGHFISFSADDLFNEANKIAAQRKSDVVLIMSYPLDNIHSMNLILLKAFTGSMMGENYYVYKMQYVPQLPENLNNSGMQLLQHGKINEAIYIFSKALYIKPGYIEAYLNLVKCYSDGAHEFDKALACIDSAIKYSPNDERIVFNKGAILFNKGDEQGAKGFFKQTIQLKPGFAVAYLCLARCYLQEGNNNEARKNIELAMKVEPNNTDALNLLKECDKK